MGRLILERSPILPDILGADCPLSLDREVFSGFFKDVLLDIASVTQKCKKIKKKLDICSQYCI
jgi:hypothetical protein